MELLLAILENARCIARRTFLKHCACKQKDIPASDWHIGYYRSQVAGVLYYFYDHSAIEYIFRKTDNL